jgi:HlyD family secretion protein
MKLGWLIFGILVLGGIALYADFSGSGSPSPGDRLTTRVKRQDLTVELHVIGVLDAAQSHMITSELQGNEGKIVNIVDDGTRVEKGDLLVQFDPAPFQKQVEQLQAEVAGFEAAVEVAEQTVAFEKNQVEQELANAKYQLNVAKLELKRLEEGEGPLQQSQYLEELQKAKMELQRYEQYYHDLESLQQQGFSNTSELAATGEKVSALAKQHQSAAGRYENYTKNVLPALIESGRAKEANASLMIEQLRQGGRYRIAKTEATLSQIHSKLEAQRDALTRARGELANTEIRAPFAGIVIHFETFREREKRKPRVGDTVFMNQPILYLPDISKMEVKTKVREIDLYKLALGQTGRVRVDAYPDTLFTGKLNFIGALATSESSQPGEEKFFQVSFILEEEDKRLRPGMTCRTTILSQNRPNALTVPVQAVFTQNETSYCYVANTPGGYTLQQVVIGARNNDIVEIVDGLQEGDLVSLVRPEE